MLLYSHFLRMRLYATDRPSNYMFSLPKGKLDNQYQEYVQCMKMSYHIFTKQGLNTKC